MQFKKVRLLLLLFLGGVFFGTSPAWAQTQKISFKRLEGVGLELDVHYGKLLLHSANMKHFQRGPSTMFELSLMQQTNGRLLWSHYHRQPVWGLSMSYTRFGNPVLLGNAYGLLPFFEVHLIRGDKFSIWFRGGSGIAWLDKKYDQIDNPEHTAIGSKLNNLTYASFFANYQVSKMMVIRAGSAFKHYSNGAFKGPNLGLNVPDVAIGVRHYLKAPLPPHAWDSLPAYDNKVHLELRFNLGFRESIPAGGPRSPIYIGTVSVNKQVSHANRVYAGMYVAYNTSVYDFILNNELFVGQQTQTAMRVGFELSDEFLFHHIGFQVQAGVYLYNKFLKQGAIYNRLAAKYYFLDDRAFVGVFMKSHARSADMIELGAGFRI